MSVADVQSLKPDPQVEAVTRTEKTTFDISVSMTCLSQTMCCDVGLCVCVGVCVRVRVPMSEVFSQI